jgi:hypothetical protein
LISEKHGALIGQCLEDVLIKDILINEYHRSGDKALEMDNKFFCQANEILKEIQSACDDFGLHSLRKTLSSVKSFAEQINTWILA